SYPPWLRGRRRNPNQLRRPRWRRGRQCTNIPTGPLSGGRSVEKAFGWAKTIAGMAKVKVRGLKRVRHAFTFAMAAYNLIRMPRLLATA
ncbi:MAG: transposase, partial [Hyphomicrobiaceae bacterium]